ncbi:MAG: helix-turn-helix transcriptional regulator [Litoreibacter sp.]
MISPRLRFRQNAELVRSFAKALKARRKAAGVSQKEFAHRLGLSVSYISLLETENRQSTLTVLDAIAKEFGISAAEFVVEYVLQPS